MSDIFILPGVWTAFIGIAGVLIAAIGMMQIDHARALASGLRALPSRWGMTGRFVLGHLAALPLAAVPVLLIASAGVDGMPRLLLATTALGIYLYVGIVIPRKPVTNSASSRDIFGCSKNRQNRIVENSTYPLDDFGFR